MADQDARRKQLMFNKMVDDFALELNDSEKERLIFLYQLPQSYHQANVIMVFHGLKMMGIYDYIDNPEGILDIAGLLNREDLKLKFRERVKEFKQNSMRRISTARNLEEHLQIVEAIDLHPLMNQAIHRIQLDIGDLEILHRMTKQQLRDKTEQRDRIMTYFGAAVHHLTKSVDTLSMIDKEIEDAVAGTTDPLPIEETPILLSECWQESTKPMYETTTKHPVSSTKASIISSAAAKNASLSPVTIPRSSSLPERPNSIRKKKGPPPPPKPKKEHLAKYVPQPSQDEAIYDLPINYTSEGTSSSTGDSGIGGWPSVPIIRKGNKGQLSF
jgi:hypothetical protein